MSRKYTESALAERITKVERYRINTEIKTGLPSREQPWLVEEYVDIINDIKNNGDKYSREDWEKLFEKDHHMLNVAMLHNSNLPSDMVAKILYKTLEQDMICQVLFREPLSDIEAENIVNIIASRHIDMNKVLDFAYYYIKKQNELHKDICYISDKFVNALAKYAHKNMPVNRTTSEIFKYVTDREFMLSMLNEDTHENILSQLANNQNLTSEERVCALECGFNISMIHLNNVTPEMATFLYHTIIEGRMEFEVQNEFKANGESFLSRLIHQGKLPYACEIDLVNRYLEKDIKKKDDLIYDFAAHSKNPVALKEATKLKGINKDKVYENPNTPIEIINEKVTKDLKGIFKGKYTQKQLQEVIYLCFTRTLSDECYNAIIDKLDSETAIHHIAYSKATPTHILEKLSNDYNQNRNYRCVAVANNLLKDFEMLNQLSDMEKEKILRTINSMEALYEKKVIDTFYPYTKYSSGHFAPDYKNKDLVNEYCEFLEKLMEHPLINKPAISDYKRIMLQHLQDKEMSDKKNNVLSNARKDVNEIISEAVYSGRSTMYGKLNAYYVIKEKVYDYDKAIEQLEKVEAKIREEESVCID